ncbi:GntR family transcriptional regulator [Hamadaea tsunoensis]|uniref:GntR family transcriptional regulator n=1 Tax=Hamadaea tsunoensis TaxID=53368 RepID=UPI000409E3D9|nr:GntR family transcriptional regulator [Hamadaea tsunoensis]
MIVEVDTGSAVPVYEQIRAQIAGLIETGQLPPGRRLPPVRQLAADLGLAVNTAARAYRELEGAGLVTSRVRHGTVVAPRPALSAAAVAERLDVAARDFARVAHGLGVGAEQAEQAIRAALRTA